jgi:RNA polymerase sigma factor (sigma-70 family)
MPTIRKSVVLQHIRKTFFDCDVSELPDADLLASFLSCRDENAFAALVRRHGPMVWGVCRRLLYNHHDAEDAFQATFLILLRKAASVRPRDLLANWLHGVAFRTALKAKTMASRRRQRERQLAESSEPAVAERMDDLAPLLDQELNRLPEKYRVAIVLCDLEGKTRKEAARQLRVPEGTVAGRLARARALLARRLKAQGLDLRAHLWQWLSPRPWIELVCLPRCSPRPSRRQLPLPRGRAWPPASPPLRLPL